MCDLTFVYQPNFKIPFEFGFSIRYLKKPGSETGDVTMEDPLEQYALAYPATIPLESLYSKVYHPPPCLVSPIHRQDKLELLAQHLKEHGLHVRGLECLLAELEPQGQFKYLRDLTSMYFNWDRKTIEEAEANQYWTEDEILDD